MASDFHDNVREGFVGLFLVAPIEGGVEILFAGALLMTIENDKRLPPGFFDRMVRSIMDLLTNRATALWDEQAIFGDRHRDTAALRAMAGAWADEQAELRERAINEPSKGEPATGSVRENDEHDTAGHA